jgi:hypothetical protein
MHGLELEDASSVLEVPFYMHHDHGQLGTEWSARTWNYQLKNVYLLASSKIS